MMMKRVFTAVLLIFLSAGCATTRGIVPRRTFTIEEARHYIGINSLRVNTIKAKVDVTIKSPELESPLSCQGYLRIERPRKLRVVCSKLFNTVFDIVSNGKEFWLYVPTEKKIYTGVADEGLSYLGLNFSPNDIAGLLDFEEIISKKRILFKPVPQHWELHVFDAQGAPYCKLLIDKKTLLVSYIESFNPDGSLKMQATLGEYQTIEDCHLPRHLDIYWPKGDVHLALHLNKLAVNEKLDPKVFQISAPKGVKTMRVTETYIGPKTASQ